MMHHAPPPAGAIRTRVLLLLIALIVCGAVGTVILSHVLGSDEKPAPARPTSALPPGIASTALAHETPHYAIVSNATPEQL